jgi:hypothetical protein
MKPIRTKNIDNPTLITYYSVLQSFNMEFTSDELAGRSRRTEEVPTTTGRDISDDSTGTDKPNTSVQ